jgi:beta-catenin-like protein 1
MFFAFSMDVSELLNFKPSAAPKRPSQAAEDPEEALDEEMFDDPNESYEKRAAKRRKLKKAAQRKVEEQRLAMLEAEAAAAASASNGSEAGPSEEVLARLAKIDDVGDEVLDESKLKRMVLNFEKKISKNQELRIKFPDDPAKFMSSEVELHDAVQEMRVVATAPDLYPILVDMECLATLLGLLSHDNADISVAVVDLLQEMTDIDTLNESEDGTSSLVQALAVQQICALLVQNLERLNDMASSEESDGIHNTLAIVENLIEFRPEFCKEAAEAGLLLWLISKRLKVKVPFDGNKLYASEILSILVQNESHNRRLFSELAPGGVAGGAMDSLLQQLAYYKRHDPSSAEEQELMENLFDVLCALLLYPPNRDLFLKAEGLQLMNLMLREKKASRNGALKVLNHALSGPEGKENCVKFVDVLGLRTIFPLFMKTPKKQKRKGVSIEQHEEHVISIVASLLKNCRGSQKQRILTKFTESDHEKVERLMELHFKYVDQVTITEERLRAAPEEMDEDELYLERISGGLYALQLVDYIIVDVCANGSQSVKQRVHQILNQRKASVQNIRNIIREYAGTLGDEDDDASEEDQRHREQERQYLLQLVDKF